MMATGAEQTESQLESGENAATGANGVLRKLFWFGVFLALLLSFTLIKLPQTRLKNLVQGEISNALAPFGVTFAAQEATLSLFLTPHYRFKGVTLTPPPPAHPILIDELEVAPSLASALLMRPGGTLSLRQGKGSLKGDAWMKGTQFGATIDASSLDLKSLGVLKLLAQLSGGGVLNGKIDLSGDAQAPNTWNGTAKLSLSKIQIDSQSISGFNLPAIAISDGQADVTIVNGKAMIRSLKLGKAGNAGDDLIASMTGDLQLARQLPNSMLNLKTQFRLSERLHSAIPLLDMILQSGKRADGDYGWQISGPLAGPAPTPLPN